MAQASASVVVATYGESELLDESLSRVRAQLEPAGAELLVVVNRPLSELGPGRVEALSRERTRVLCEERTGKSHALNLGVRESRGDICAFIDDDALAEPGWLSALLGPLLADPACAGVGGRVLPQLPERGVPPWYRALLAGRRTFFLGPVHDLGPEPLDYRPGSYATLPLGANCAFRRELVGAIGYAPQLGPNRLSGTRGGEDTLLARTLLDRGHRLVYAPQALVHCPVSAARLTPRFALEGYFWQGVEKVRVERALGIEGGPAQAWNARLGTVLSAPLAWIARWLPDPLLVRRLKRRQFYRGVLAELHGRANRVRPLAWLPPLAAAVLLARGDG